MSTPETTIPPTIPPEWTGDGGGDGGGGHRIQVTRNVPPKRVMVRPGATVTVAGRVYAEGESFLLPGPEADSLEFPPFGPPPVVIVSHEEVDAWNGDEGRTEARRALAYVDKNHVHQAAHIAFNQFLRGEITAAEMGKLIATAEKEDPPARTHDHGYEPYKHADKHGQEAEVTRGRQRLAREHMHDPTKPDVMTNDQAGLEDPKE